METTTIKEGAKMFLRRARVLLFGIRKYEASGRNAEERAENIIEQIIEECWNGRYFTVSSGNFRLFYTRDFGLCCRALIELGHKERVRKTLIFAIDAFRKKGKVCTSVNDDGRAFDFPKYASDSLPFLIRSLRMLADKRLILENKDFLNKCVKEHLELVFDKKNGMVKRKLWLSSIKDYAIRDSSCYDNCMCLMLKNELEKIKVLENPFKKYDIEKKIVEELFNGKYFYNDMQKEDEVYADANIFPYYCDIKKGMREGFLSMVNAKLDEPFPIKYQNKRKTKEKQIWQEIFARGYERDSIWMHMMPVFLRLVKETDKKKYEKYLTQMIELVDKEKNYLEVYENDGRRFKRMLYYTDESMIWGSMLLALMKGKEIL